MYYNKYLKYKSKYFNSLNMKGGTIENVIIRTLSGNIIHSFSYNENQNLQIGELKERLKETCGIDDIVYIVIFNNKEYLYNDQVIKDLQSGTSLKPINLNLIYIQIQKNEEHDKILSLAIKYNESHVDEEFGAGFDLSKVSIYFILNLFQKYTGIYVARVILDELIKLEEDGKFSYDDEILKYLLYNYKHSYDSFNQKLKDRIKDNNFLNTKDKIRKVITRNARLINHVNETYIDDDIVLDLVKKRSITLIDLSIKFRSNEKIVSEAIKHDVKEFRYASDTLKNDKEFVKKKLVEKYNILDYVSNTLQNDEDVVRTALEKNQEALLFASERLKNDKDIVRIAVTKRYNTLRHASENLRGDAEFVSQLVSENGLVLNYALPSLKNDPNVVQLAVENNPKALQFASETLKEDANFISELVKKKPEALQYASESLKEDAKFISELVKKNPEVFQYASEILKSRSSS